MVDGKSERKMVRENSRNYYINAVAYSPFSPLPYSKEAQAIA